MLEEVFGIVEDAERAWLVAAGEGMEVSMEAAADEVDASLEGTRHEDIWGLAM